MNEPSTRRESSTALKLTQALALLLATAGVLRGLDWWPRAASRAAQLHELPTIESVERAAGRHLTLPAVFPSTLPWPPVRVQVLGRVPESVALDIGPRDGGVPLLVLAESVREPVPLPASFFPPALQLETRAIDWRDGQAQLTHLRGDDGATWVDLTWQQDGQTFSFRTRGSVEQLLELAASVHREGP